MANYNFEDLTAFIDGIGEKYGVPGSDCIITENGRIIYRHSAGYSDLENKVPVSPEDTHWIYSASKLFTVVAAQKLISEGKIDPEAPVGRYIPEFSEMTVKQADGSIAPAQNTMLVKDLLTMTGGLNYDLATPQLNALKEANPEYTTLDFAKALASQPLDFEPGTHFRYSLCLDVIGAIIEIASGMSFEEYLRQNICEPLGLKNTSFHPTESMMAHCVQQYSQETGETELTHKDNGLVPSPNLESGGAGLMSTLDDYSTFAAALSLGGISADGVRIIDEDALKCMCIPRLGAQELVDYHVFKPEFYRYSYGFGVRTLVNNDDSPWPLGLFGWDGAAGAFVSVDPERKISVCYFQQVLRSQRTFKEVHQELILKAYECMR